MKYKHTQIGYLIIFVLAILIAYFIYLTSLLYTEPTAMLFSSIIIFVKIIILISFITLTVTIDENYLKIKFGYGIYSKRFDLKEIIWFILSILPSGLSVLLAYTNFLNKSVNDSYLGILGIVWYLGIWVILGMIKQPLYRLQEMRGIM